VTMMEEANRVTNPLPKKRGGYAGGKNLNECWWNKLKKEKRGGEKKNPRKWEGGLRDTNAPPTPPREVFGMLGGNVSRCQCNLGKGGTDRRRPWGLLGTVSKTGGAGPNQLPARPPCLGGKKERGKPARPCSQGRKTLAPGIGGFLSQETLVVTKLDRRG